LERSNRRLAREDAGLRSRVVTSHSDVFAEQLMSVRRGAMEKRSFWETRGEMLNASKGKN
jgi:hypothetical protein